MGGLSRARGPHVAGGYERSAIADQFDVMVQRRQLPRAAIGKRHDGRRAEAGEGPGGLCGRAADGGSIGLGETVEELRARRPIDLHFAAPARLGARHEFDEEFSSALLSAEGRSDRVKIDALVDAGGEAGEHRPRVGGEAGRGGCDGVICAAPKRLGARLVSGRRSFLDRP